MSIQKYISMIEQPTYLQTMSAPQPHLADIDDAFGGIGTFRGLDAEARNYLLSIARFTHMGNAVFEFGTIPKSLKAISDGQKEYMFTEMSIRGTIFYLIIGRDMLDEYKVALEEVSHKDYHVEYHGLHSIISGTYTSDEPLLGWLDIKNNVMFFRDHEMAMKMSASLIGKIHLES